MEFVLLYYREVRQDCMKRATKGVEKRGFHHSLAALAAKSANPKRCKGRFSGPMTITLVDQTVFSSNENLRSYDGTIDGPCFLKSNRTLY